MTALKPYPEYKDGGADWLGPVPSGWSTAALRHVARVVNGGTPSPAEENWNGDVFWATPVDLNAFDGASLGTTGRLITEVGLLSGSARVPSRSVLVSTRAPIGYSAVTAVPMAFNQGCKGLIPLAYRVEPEYLLYLVQASKAKLSSLGQGTTFSELSGGALSGLKLCVPTLQEQRAIVSFLDQETVEIDAFIADQQELIGLLNERRAATITQAVTKGLDPNVPMKDSGVEGFGPMPEAWEAWKLKSLVSVPITDGPHETPELQDEGIPFVSAEAVSTGRINFSKVRGYISPEDHRRFSRKYLPQRSDIYMIKSGATTGVCAIVETDQAFNIWSPLAAIRCGRGGPP